MRADEFITESRRVLVEGSGHLDHPEDLVLLQGSAGSQKALMAMTDTISNPGAITIKFDGQLALIWGYGPDGKFSVMDKHMFNKGSSSSARYIHSPQAFIQYDIDRGNERIGLAQFISNIWSELQQLTPKKQGYFWGDVLFTEPLTIQKDGMYHFTPNPKGIRYTVEANSPIGQKYFKDKQAGIAVHQFLDVNAKNTEDSKTKQSLNGTTGGIGQGKYLSILPAAMPQTPTLKLNQRLFNVAKSTIASSGPGMDQFFRDSPQTNPREGPPQSVFHPLLTRYINQKVREGNFKNLVAGFIPFLETSGKLSKSMAAKLLGYVDPKTNKKVPGYIQTHMNGLKDIFKVWAAIYNFKMSIVPQLDKAALAAPIQGYLNDGRRSQEGFVSHGVKLIDRLGFSRQNLAGNKSATRLTEDTNKQLLVIYPGGFHPFHLGHASVFDHLAKKFSDADVFVAATDTTTERPFEFKDKSFLANQSGVPNGRFVQVKSPYRSTEITQNYDSENTVLVFAVSEKDHDRISFKPKKDGSPSYFQPYHEGDLAPMNRHGYIYVVPKIDFKIAGEQVDSASKIRKMYAAADDQKKQQIIGDLYPHAKAPKRIRQILDRVLGGLTEADNPNYFGGSSQSAIPGTPPDLQPRPSAKKLRQQRREERAIQRFMGH